MSDKETTKTSSGSGSGNPNVFQSPMLTSTNYTIWAIRMKVLLNMHKVWDTIDPGATDDDKNNIAIALIYQSIKEATVMQLGNIESAKEIWNAIKETILQTLMNEFDGMRMKKTKTIDEFVAKLLCTASKEASLGEMIEETKMVKKFQVYPENEKKVIAGNYESKDGDEWYLDNSASNHMTGNKSFFSELNNRVTGNVKFGDDSYVNISGKGSILFEAKRGEHRLLTDVYSIPSLRSNIISLGQQLNKFFSLFNELLDVGLGINEADQRS
ncbi:uncharacterized protein LOC143594251 [Bidens hawaiensis]|uniref:uncharacterized protein LOC143594251 n=1 Tax=Bidens hawaiensis TaxID=980011 RepID=UPI00404B65C4